MLGEHGYMLGEHGCMPGEGGYMLGECGYMLRECGYMPGSAVICRGVATINTVTSLFLLFSPCVYFSTRRTLPRVLNFGSPPQKKFIIFLINGGAFDYIYFSGGVELLTRTVPVNKFLLTGTVARTQRHGQPDI